MALRIDEARQPHESYPKYGASMGESQRAEISAR